MFQTDRTVTVEIDRLDAGTLSTLVGIGINIDDPLLSSASARLADTFRKAVMKAMGPERCREALAEALDSIPDDAPDNLRETLEELKAEIEAMEKDDEITEDEIDSTDIGELARQLAKSDGDSTETEEE